MAVADPTALEERVSDASLIFAINSFKEVCAMHLGGSTLTSPALIFRCSSKAADRAKRIVDFIKESLEEDTRNRENGTVKGFADCIRLSRVPSKVQPEELVEHIKMEEDEIEDITEIDDKPVEIVKVDSNIVSSKNDFSKFEVQDSSEDSSEPEEKLAKLEIQTKKQKGNKKKDKKKLKLAPKTEDSEDEETIVITSLDP